MEIKAVKVNTYCIDTGMTYIPLYKVNDEEVIMLDTGWNGILKYTKVLCKNSIASR